MVCGLKRMTSLKIKKFLFPLSLLSLFIFIFSLLFFVSATRTDAQNLGWDTAEKAAVSAGYDKGTGETTFSGSIGTVIGAALSLLGVFFLVLMVYAGYLWMTARDEEAQVEKAQKIIMAAVIGLIIVVGAYSITTFVVPRILERTTGEGGKVGGVLVECCNVCGNWEITCPPLEKITEANCATKKGKYLGKVPAGECQ
jgi:hypothetical protein